MKYIKSLSAGSRMTGIYLCKYKQGAVTKNGKPYDNIILMDKTGTINGKIWEPNSPGIGEFESLDYIDVIGDVSTYNGALQVSVSRARKVNEGEYDPKDYLPCTELDIDQLYADLLKLISETKNSYLNQLLQYFFIENKASVSCFKHASAAKSVHHGFIGGLMEHSVSVAKLCTYMSGTYPFLNRDLLVTAALLHDIGKTKELSAFPANDYTDEGQLIGHIIIGTEMIHDAIKEIPGFPEVLERLLKHCILAHHGELEFGSPKKPAIAEAMALSMADNMDAKMQTMKEILQAAEGQKELSLGYNRLFETTLRKTGNLPE